MTQERQLECESSRALLRIMCHASGAKIKECSIRVEQSRQQPSGAESASDTLCEKQLISGVANGDRSVHEVPYNGI